MKRKTSIKTSKQSGWQAALIAAFFLFFLSTSPALSQSGPPPIPIVWLDSYSFSQTNPDSDFGCAPISETNAFSIPFWYYNALWLDTTNEVPAYAHYNIVETNGFVNLDQAAGTIFIQVVPDWASADTNQFGLGPGSRGNLLASGDFSTGSPDGLWAIDVDSGGTNIYFGGISNSVTNIYVSAPISWATNSLHEIGVYYRTNSELYLTLWWDADTNSYYKWLDGDGGEGDLLPDGYEILATHTDPYLPDTGLTGTNDAYKDPDGDGFVNIVEYYNGTDPLVFNTPAGPSRLSVVLNSNGTCATIS